jgi:hypothetical protein
MATMATEKDKAHARRLLEIHTSNLRELEERAAMAGGDVPLILKNQIDQERADIAALEPIAKPAPSQGVQTFVTGVSDGNGGNWAMLFSQFVLLNARMTKQEEQNQRIIDEQFRASQWRLTAGQDIEALKDDTRAGERGRVRNLGLLLGSMVLMGIVIAGVLLLVLR